MEKKLSPEIQIAVNKFLSNPGRTAKEELGADLPNPADHLLAVAEIYRARARLNKNSTLPTVIPDPKLHTKLISLTEVNRQIALACSEPVLKSLLETGDSVPLALNLIRLPPGRSRQRVFNHSVKKIAEAGSSRALKALIKLDDSQGKEYSRKALGLAGKRDPDTHQALIFRLSAGVLAQMGGCLDVCTPDQAATLIRMVAGKVFVTSRGQRSAFGERGEEGGRSERLARQLAYWDSQRSEADLGLGRVLDLIVERDNDAVTPENPDFGFLENVVGNLVGERGQSQDNEEGLTATLTAIVELAGKRESARTILDLLPRTPVVERAIRGADESSPPFEKDDFSIKAATQLVFEKD